MLLYNILHACNTADRLQTCSFFSGICTALIIIIHHMAYLYLFPKMCNLISNRFSDDSEHNLYVDWIVAKLFSVFRCSIPFFDYLYVSIFWVSNPCKCQIQKIFNKLPNWMIQKINSDFWWLYRCGIPALDRKSVV